MRTTTPFHSRGKRRWSLLGGRTALTSLPSTSLSFQHPAHRRSNTIISNDNDNDNDNNDDNDNKKFTESTNNKSSESNGGEGELHSQTKMSTWQRLTAPFRTEESSSRDKNSINANDTDKTIEESETQSPDNVYIPIRSIVSSWKELSSYSSSKSERRLILATAMHSFKIKEVNRTKIQ